jgi:hypothetical protein
MLGLIEAIVVSQTVSHTYTGTFTTGTVTMSGTDSRIYAPQSGTISVTITLSGSDTDLTASSNTMLRDRHHNVLVSG